MFTGTKRMFAAREERFVALSNMLRYDSILSSFPNARMDYYKIPFMGLWPRLHDLARGRVEGEAPPVRRGHLET